MPNTFEIVDLYFVLNFSLKRKPWEWANWVGSQCGVGGVHPLLLCYLEMFSSAALKEGGETD